MCSQDEIDYEAQKESNWCASLYFSLIKNVIGTYKMKRFDRTVKLDYNELGCWRTLRYNEHIFKSNWSF
jgi:hypothetical protein